MSLCQSKTSSCGACCGLFNIDYPLAEIKKILTDRTEYFLENVDYSKRETVISFREVFEAKENNFLKKDNTIYNCPFLGYIDSIQSKIGCLIHPIKTGDPKSQNFSFYGASICQTYDCKNKEKSNASAWEIFLDSLGLSFYEYSNIAGDHILIESIEKFFISCGISVDELLTNHSILFKKIIKQKLNLKSQNITSFEIDMKGTLESTFKKLIDILQLDIHDSLYLELERFELDKKNDQKILGRSE